MRKDSKENKKKLVLDLIRSRIKKKRHDVKIRANNKRKEQTDPPKIKIRSIVKNKTKKKNITFNIPRKKNDYKSIYKPIEKWGNIINGVPAFLIGNSPSVSEEDLHVLDPYFTIGLNRICLIYDPTILMWQDKEVFKTSKNEILKSQAIKIAATKADPTHMFLNFNVKTGGFKIPKKIENLHGWGNTGVLSAQFAIKMGCSALVLIGMDCKYEGDKTDFYGQNKDHKPYTLKMCLNSMRWLIDNSPIPVFNCSKGDYAEQRNLKDVIKELNPERFSRDYFNNKFMK